MPQETQLFQPSAESFRANLSTRFTREHPIAHTVTENLIQSIPSQMQQIYRTGVLFGLLQSPSAPENPETTMQKVASHLKKRNTFMYNQTEQMVTPQEYKQHVFQLLEEQNSTLAQKAKQIAGEFISDDTELATFYLGLVDFTAITAFSENS